VLWDVAHIVIGNGTQPQMMQVSIAHCAVVLRVYNGNGHGTPFLVALEHVECGAVWRNVVLEEQPGDLVAVLPREAAEKRSRNNVRRIFKSVEKSTGRRQL